METNKKDDFSFTKNKDNFRIYHEENRNNVAPKQSLSTQERNSIYLQTSDIPLEQRIVNEAKPQVTLRYLHHRQHSSQTDHGKRKKTTVKNYVKA